MELTPKHRQALIDKMLETMKELAITKKCLEEFSERDIAGYFDMDCFIQQQTIELIKRSLIQNEIDY